MNRSLLFLLLTFLCTQVANAQLTYNTSYSNPEEIHSGYLGLNYFTDDAGFSNTSGASIWSVGADALYPISDRLNVEALALYSLFSLAKEGPAFLFSPGVEFTLTKKTKEQTVPVLLGFSYEKDYINNKEIQTWSTVKLPGDVTRELVLRGGLYLRNSALEYEENFTYYDITNVFHAGVYVGAGYNWKSYLQVQDSDGYEFAAGRFIRPFADVMIIPTSVDLELNNAPAKTIKETLGWRVGGVIVAKPFTKELNFGRKFGFFGNFIYRLEVGQRPLEGFYVTSGISFGLMKFK